MILCSVQESPALEPARTFAGQQELEPGRGVGGGGEQHSPELDPEILSASKRTCKRRDKEFLGRVNPQSVPERIL